MFQAPDATRILRPLGEWFDAHRRSLPWRALDLDRPHPDAYAVLVSELMLQQTQVSTVIPYFSRWMSRFPDLGSLASAAESEVFGLWSGLGYYQRARNLQRATQVIAEQGWPTTVEGLRQLPGLGPYASAAVAAIAFQLPEPALDGNAFRVLARLLGLEADPRTLRGPLESWLRPALASLGPSRLTQALMELGATHCGRKAVCDACPLATHCAALKMGAQQRIPPPRPRAKSTEVRLWLLAIHCQEQWLLVPPKHKGLLSGLWSWPHLTQETWAEETATVPQGMWTWKGWTQVYTHRREIIQPLRLDIHEPIPMSGCTWLHGSELGRLAFGRRDQLMRDLLETPALPPLMGMPSAERILETLKGGGGLEG